MHPRVTGAGWSSPVARQAHNLKVTGSNPVPATIKISNIVKHLGLPRGRLCHLCPQAIAAFVAAFESRLVGERPVCTLGARSALENDDPGSYEVDPCHSVSTPPLLKN